MITETIVDGYLIRDHDDGTVEQIWVGTNPVERPTLTLALSAAVVASGAPVDWSVDVRYADGSLAPITGTYYVPVIRQDGWQARLITVPILNGVASGQISIAEAGIYTVDLARVRPVTQSSLGIAPELIVSET